VRARDFMYWVLIKKWAGTRWLDEVADGSVTTGDFELVCVEACFFFFFL
jgi:hypothetical protein